MKFFENLTKALVLVGALCAPQTGAAFDATDDIDNFPFSVGRIGTCIVVNYVSAANRSAYLYVANGTNFMAGGAFFQNGGSIDNSTYSEITTALIAGCLGITAGDIPYFVQDGPDGTFETDNLIGFKFTLAEGLVGLPVGFVAGGTYEFKVGTGSLPDAGPTVEQNQNEVAQFMLSRAGHTLAAQPDLVALRFGSAPGTFDANVTQGTGVIDYTTNGDQPVWTQFQGDWSENGGNQNSYFFGVVGADVNISPHTLAGVMLQFDKQTQENSAATTEGTGYLVGPYLVSKLPEQPLFFEGRLLVGRTENSVTFTGAGPQAFSTDRALASVKVAGQLSYGNLLLTPSLAASHLEDTQRAFTNSSGATVPEQSIKVSDIALGLNFAQPLRVDTGHLMLTGGVSGIWSKTEGTGLAGTVNSNFEGRRGRVQLGSTYTLENAMTLNADANYDGIGTDNFHSFGLSFGVEMEF